jgi:hypothetical protein
MIFSQREDTTRPLTDHSIEADLRRSHGLHPTPKISLWVSNPALNFGIAAKEILNFGAEKTKRKFGAIPSLPETQPRPQKITRDPTI